jgi:phosphoglycerol transferase MdoB-like AlkP superfamily enzyme
MGSMRLTRLTSVSRSFRPLVMTAVSGLLLIFLFRCAFVVWQWPRVAAVGQLQRIFLTGLQMDLQLISYLLFPALLLWPAAGGTTNTGAWAVRLLRIWYCLVVLFLLFMETATPSFLSEYGVRPNRLFFDYLIYYREVGSMLWKQYKLQLILSAVILPLAGRYAWRISILFRPTAGDLSPLQRMIVLPLVAALLVLGARSSLGHRPANISSAAFSSDPLVNGLALSSAYTLLYAVYQLKHEKDPGHLYGHLPEEETLRRVTRATGYPPSAFTDPSRPTWHFQQATRPRQSPLNLVIILEESLGAQFVESLGGLPLTPELVRLSSQGLWFEQLYATGTRSVRGIEAVVTGFPPSPARSVVKLASRGGRFFNLAAHLKPKGYQSVFIYGGESHFDNMRGFFLSNGFDRVVDEENFDNPAFRGTWGVCDEDLFDRAHREFEAYGDQSFFSLVFTSSYHAPFEFPPGRLKKEELTNNPEHNAVRYADFALGRFFDKARNSSYWNRTLFLVVADHDSRVRGAELVPVNHFHIPGLVIGPGVAPDVCKTVASQIDLPSTLLSLMGISSFHPMIGHDLSLAGSAGKGRAIMQYNSSFAYREGNRVTILQPDKDPMQFTYAGLKLHPAEPAPLMARKALAHALWPFMAYENRYYTLPDAN